VKFTGRMFAAFCFTAILLSVIVVYPDARSQIRVMSYNIRCLNPDGLDSWHFRRKHVAGLVEKYDPDLLGLQEAYSSQANYLQKMLPAYDWFGKPRGKWWGQRNAVFFKRDRFEAVELGVFWLSETPDEPGSRTWDSMFKRTVSFAKLEDKNTGREILFANTHFDHVSETSRVKSAGLLVERIGGIARGAPTIIVGDFNCADKSEPYKIITERFGDSRKLSRTPPLGPVGTFRGFKRGTPPRDRIDFIFVSDEFEVLEYKTFDDTYKNGGNPSDHLPVTALLRL